MRAASRFSACIAVPGTTAPVRSSPRTVRRSRVSTDRARAVAGSRLRSAAALSSLTAYNRVISDFSGSHVAPHLAGDVSRAVSELEAAADRSRDPATARALSVLTRDLRTVRGELRAGSVVPGTAMQALNRDAARTDASCGTLHV